ncbi:16S rRNA (uracil(1498)-N(3))-methyltransferase [Helicobacter sp. MIT 05-5294]|uniref:16S rRNA (uracil(1498)-N(3))-methyltransferase n=1 Tax=Helicobacter sp. MIT 05-5294 TaxID=1548150 RepID=UPI00051FAE68|nr:16S rRNA (uracil(1498)-N(3))-methyltransferase [Helicobacter sp. MIT 05-5294]TLD86775.1 16S rRNA (uracil(1498)-N(3))-methyltransferase [Helicobacter sp. MIT 05-5294]
MQFILHHNAGEKQITLQDEIYHHLFHSRRTRKLESLYLRNGCDCNLYLYTITEVGKKDATLTLQTFESTPIENPPKGHLIWAIIEPKSIEKTLPMLNELNLAKITFFYAQYSQKHFKLDSARLDRILKSSCEQCGRILKLDFEILPNLEEVLQNYPNFAVLDFGGKPLCDSLEIPLMIGCEGGFSQSEREILQNKPTFSAPKCNILKSETAALYATSRLI